MSLNSYCEWEAHLLMKVEALDHRKRMARDRMRQWHNNVRRWYSMTSNRSQMAVAPASTPPDIFLFLHRTRSAAACARISHKSKQLTNK